jgi:hypothetical protein
MNGACGSNAMFECGARESGVLAAPCAEKSHMGAAGVNIKTRNDGNCDTMAHNRVKLHQLAHRPELQITMISKAGIL